MSIKVALHHYTRYEFDRKVTLSPHVLRLRPAPHSRTPIDAYALKVTPENHFINWQQDPFGNVLARIVFPEATDELSIEVDLVANLTVINPFDFFVEEYAENFPFKYEESLREELLPYLKIAEDGPLLKEWVAKIPRDEQHIVDFIVDINRRLFEALRYNIRMEPGIQPCETTLEKQSGSCRDSGWLLVQILRHFGLAARFVSGYLVQLTADIPSLDGPSGPEEDFTDLHAWAEVYIPGAGWIGLDPTSGLFAGEGHIPLAGTPDPASAAPVTGAMDPCEVEFFHKNEVHRIHEDPRVTKPYTDEAWADILALGERVEQRLVDADVRLTMGGEPTFVAIDNTDEPEWNTAADGQHKRERAEDLFRRMQERYAPGGVLHFGQGKWYPGEPLPRWAMNCFWRLDGEPVWRDPALLASPAAKGTFESDTAEKFLMALAGRLGVHQEHITPAWEDIMYFLWQEGRLPDGMDPLNDKLGDHLERHKLREILNRGLDVPVGYVLPLAWEPAHDTWISAGWTFRDGRLFLAPGNSPLGLRLPLDNLQTEDEKKVLKPQPESEWQDLPDLESRDLLGEARAITGAADADETSDSESGDAIITALNVEIREGRVYLFLPPLTSVQHWLDLVAKIEETAAELNVPVILEGYPPPSDPRLRKFAVTPDPGVIEVNIHPGSSWAELVENTETLYEDARLSRLTTEKFLVDGKHTGTGGGNHCTIGGATPKDSPVLRRPALIQSLVTFWQHHPGLSYLFSGLFIGPTSQAPRVDEGRDEQLYELEVAFDSIPEGDVDQPWLADRLLRHLLVDITGNTHRSEFCIDKLYSPDSETGRQGLVEFRAFEMPPHARMSLVQMLLLRALIACFWDKPYRKPLVRWGTLLHDRFMLPHYVHSDLRDVVAYLRAEGLDFRMEWLDPFFEFRFPHYGQMRVGDIHMELRMAIEPWHVLGEEATASGTSRFVDSSVERLQVRVTGLTDGRHVLCCNGQQVPMHNTGTQGEYVAGVRYQAWQPTSSLHPTIPVQTPLVFDVIDSWNGHAIGGCTYHVGHPGGRNYETVPVNAWEAEGRRISRFWDYGHTPGTIRVPPSGPAPGTFSTGGSGAVPMDMVLKAPLQSGSAGLRGENPEFPHTLDLRRCGPR